MKWTFRVVRADLSATVVRRPHRQSVLDAGPEEALAFAARVRAHLADDGPNPVLRVEAHSAGGLGVEVTSPLADDLARFTLRANPRGPGWRCDEGRLAHPCWHRSLDQSISYAAFRGRGYVVEIRVLDQTDKLARVVLMDLRGISAFAGPEPNCASSCRRNVLQPFRGWS